MDSSIRWDGVTRVYQGNLTQRLLTGGDLTKLPYWTEAAELVPPDPDLSLLLLKDDLLPDLPTHGQLSTLGRLYLPEDGEDLVSGKVWQGLLILLESCWQE